MKLIYHHYKNNLLFKAYCFVWILLGKNVLAQVCQDKTSEKFVINKRGTQKNCRQILRKFAHLCNFKPIVQENCPFSCGICGYLGNESFCVDTTGYFTVGSGTQWEKERTCQDVKKQPEKLCKKNVFKRHCPQVCNLCEPSGVKCNGLASNCDMPVNELLFASLHNANHDDPPFQNHNSALENALVAGYRGLFLDVCKCGNEEELIFCHGTCALGRRDITTVMRNIVSFLESNPKDVIIFNFEMSVGDPTPQELWNVMSSIPGLESRVYEHRPSSGGASWPTLGTLTDAGKQIIAFQHNGPDCPSGNGCNSKINDFFDYTMGTDWSFDSVSSIENWENSCQIKRGAYGKKEFYSINHFVTTFFGPSGSASSVINQEQFLMNRIGNCTNIMKAEPNFVSIDYWQRGDLLKVTMEVNAKRAA